MINSLLFRDTLRDQPTKQQDIIDKLFYVKNNFKRSDVHREFKVDVELIRSFSFSNNGGLFFWTEVNNKHPITEEFRYD